jgi:hypothetical protein
MAGRADRDDGDDRLADDVVGLLSAETDEMVDATNSLADLLDRPSQALDRPSQP